METAFLQDFRDAAKSGFNNAVHFYKRNHDYEHGIVETEYVLTTKIAEASLEKRFLAKLECNPLRMLNVLNSSKKEREEVRDATGQGRIDIVLFRDDGLIPVGMVEVKRRGTKINSDIIKDLKRMVLIMDKVTSRGKKFWGMAVFPFRVVGPTDNYLIHQCETGTSIKDESCAELKKKLAKRMKKFKDEITNTEKQYPNFNFHVTRVAEDIVPRRLEVEDHEDGTTEEQLVGENYALGLCGIEVTKKGQ